MIFCRKTVFEDSDRALAFYRKILEQNVGPVLLLVDGTRQDHHPFMLDNSEGEVQVVQCSKDNQWSLNLTVDTFAPLFVNSLRLSEHRDMFFQAKPALFEEPEKWKPTGLERTRRLQQRERARAKIVPSNQVMRLIERMR